MANYLQIILIVIISILLIISFIGAIFFLIKWLTTPKYKYKLSSTDLRQNAIAFQQYNNDISDKPANQKSNNVGQNEPPIYQSFNNEPVKQEYNNGTPIYQSFNNGPVKQEYNNGVYYKPANLAETTETRNIVGGKLYPNDINSSPSPDFTGAVNLFRNQNPNTGYFYF